MSFLSRRLLQVVPALLAVSVLSFLLLRLAPGDPARVVAGPRASASTVAAIHRQLGLDHPLWVQYGNYLDRVFHGNLGQDLSGSQTVGQVITQSGGVTLQLVLGGVLATLVISIPLAIAAARHPGSLLDSAIRVLTVSGLALPAFWVGTMLVTYLALPTGWFPVGGWPDTRAGQLRALVLPSLTLGIGMTPIVARSLRSSLIDVLDSDYVKAGRIMGLRGWALTRRLIVRNAVVPAIPAFAIALGFLLGGTVIVEDTFNLPGLGLALVQAAQQRDANVIQGLTLLFGVSVIVVYLVADLVLSAIDPRVRL